MPDTRPNPYDQTAADLFGGNLALGARSSVVSVADRNPDEEAQLQRRAQELGIPPDSARTNPRIVQQRIAGQSVDWDNMARQAPRTTRFLNSTSHAAIAHDDIGVLGRLEQVLSLTGALLNPARTAQHLGQMLGQSEAQDTRREAQALGGPGAYLRALGQDRSLANTGREIIGGLAQIDEGISGTIEAGSRAGEAWSQAWDSNILGHFLGAEKFAKLAHGIAETATNDRTAAIQLQSAFQPQYRTRLGRDIGMGVQSLPAGAIAGLLTVLTGGTAPGLASMGITTFGQGYGEAKDSGLGEGAAAVKGGIDAIIEMATEYLPEKYLLKDVGAHSALKKIVLDQLKSEVPGEQVATLLQDFNQWAMVDANKGKSFDQYLGEIIPHAWSTLVATGVGVGTMTAPVLGLRAIERKTGNSRQDVINSHGEAGANLRRALNDVSSLAELNQSIVDRTGDDNLRETIAEDNKRIIAEAQAIAEGSPINENPYRLADSLGDNLDLMVEQAKTMNEQAAKIRRLRLGEKGERGRKFYDMLETAGNTGIARFLAKYPVALQAQEAHQHLKQMAELAGASRLQERDAPTFGNLVDQMAEGSPLESVYIPAGALDQALTADERCS